VPPDGFAMLARDFDAILVGAFGDPRVKTNIHAKEILLGMRFRMDLYANVRPVRLLDSALCPLKGVEPKDVDFVVLRENTEGAYTDAGQEYDKVEVAGDKIVSEIEDKLVRIEADFAHCRHDQRVATIGANQLFDLLRATRLER